MSKQPFQFRLGPCIEGCWDVERLCLKSGDGVAAGCGGSPAVLATHPVWAEPLVRPLAKTRNQSNRVEPRPHTKGFAPKEINTLNGGASPPPHIRRLRRHQRDQVFLRQSSVENGS